jgi:hypothetical protein
VCEVKITQPPTVSVDPVLAERNISMLFSGELGNCHYDVLFPLEERKRLCIFDEGSFHRQLFAKIFL